jgi:hypothetical protein
LASVAAVRVSPLSKCLIVTVAPGTTAPDASFSVPMMEAVTCAQTVPAIKDKIKIILVQINFRAGSGVEEKQAESLIT